MIKKVYKYITVFFSILFLIFTGCEKKFDTVINSQIDNIQVASVRAIDLVIFNPADSSITFSIRFSSINGLNGISMNIFSPSNKLINDQPVELFDNGNITNNGDTTAGDLIYSNKYLFSSNFENGSYNVEYIITLNDGITKRVASQHFIFNTGKSNAPPVVSNLILPDTVQTNVKFTFSIMVNDPDGLQDIKKVYYELFMPNGTKITNSQGISQFPLLDDGNTASNSDVTAGDGKYTNFLTFPNTVTLGTWKFNFTAIDKAGNASNTITQNVEVK